jgi:hypothetical protein
MDTEPLDEDDDRYARRHEAQADDETYHRDWPERARMRTFGPGLGTSIVGFIGILVGIAMCTVMMDMYRKQFAAQREAMESRSNMTQQQKEKMLEVHDTMTKFLLVAVPIYGGVSIFLSLLTVLSGVMLARCKVRWFCITMSVVNLIPCTINWLYLPLFVWSLVVLNNTEVIAKMRNLRSPDDVE